ncbi:MAG: B12-binding domain-containing radical SAM protein [Epulopiscium sp.]|nr:B12-binding domain-containing radical SAM protein [Candidatus Epulonipiscium sp.]
MNIILSTLNAKYLHTSLALRSIKAYCTSHKDDIKIAEYTINHQEDYILREIYKLRPDILGFSCYIWNIEKTMDLIKSIKRILPAVTIILGGPEVSYDGIVQMKNHKEIDIIVYGEGEKTFNELIGYFTNKGKSLDEIDGIIYRLDGEIVKTKKRKSVSLDELPFVYKDFDKMKNQILYYESTRGCPYRCQYCLSSRETGVRFLSLERVYFDLRKFLDAKVKQVKFVDRTFNCSKSHALAIWQFLINNDNGKTNFHFEISADILDEKTIDFLSKARPGLFQFEIGVQSTNEHVLGIIDRKMDFNKLKWAVKKIKKNKNIHQHLDLIAGLPGEDYNSFRQSFNEVYYLLPEKIQLGFLKVLKGTEMKNKENEYGLKHKNKAPYEILFTKELNYEEMLRLKMIEEMLEIYYNSQRFYYSISYIIRFFDTPFDFYEALAKHWERLGFHHIQHNKTDLYTILLEFFIKSVGYNEEIFKELLKFDMYLIEKVKRFPSWMSSSYDDYKTRIREFYRNEGNIREYLPKLVGYSPKDISRRVHLEVFPIDFTGWIKSIETGGDLADIGKKPTAILFDYYLKDNILGHSAFYKVII